MHTCRRNNPAGCQDRGRGNIRFLAFCHIQINLILRKIDIEKAGSILYFRPFVQCSQELGVHLVKLSDVSAGMVLHLKLESAGIAKSFQRWRSEKKNAGSLNACRCAE